MRKQIDNVIKVADSLVKKYGTRCPYKLAKALGIHILECKFPKQKGAYKVIEKNRFIFVKEDLDDVLKAIVILHEIAHDQLHRTESIAAGGFKEFNIFEMKSIRMEYEANIFAATISLPDDEILEYIHKGFDVAQVASVMNSDINLVALKVADLKTKGYDLNNQEFSKTFLK